MTDDYLTDVAVTTEDDFESLLAELVENAVKEDVDVRGAWEFRTDGSTHDWEVEVVELAVDSDNDD